MAAEDLHPGLQTRGSQPAVPEIGATGGDIFTALGKWPWVFYAQNPKPVPPVNIPIPTKIGSKMGGAPTPKWDPIGFDSQPK